MANISSGTLVSASGFNNLFNRLNAIRANHLNKNGQNTEANSVFTTPFAANIAIQGQKPIPNNVQQIKNNLTTLSKSAWLDTSFASKISIPATGALLRATDFNVIDNTIGEVEKICPNYSQYSNYSNYSNYSQYSNYSNYSQYSNYSNYSKYSRGGGCFLEGTLILLSDNTKKPIEQIISGDELLVYDENTKSFQKAFNFCTKKFITNKLVTISLEDGNYIQTTLNHPILTTQGWACLDPKEAEKEHKIRPILLQDNMEIMCFSGISKIKEIKQTDGIFTVYNIEVPYYHTYFANGVIVHNAWVKYG